MKVIRITNSVFETNSGGISEEKLKAGQELSIDDEEGKRQLGRNNAEIVEATPAPALETESPADHATESGEDAAAEGGKKRGKKAE